MPGLLVATPSTPADAKGLLKTAIRDENPVIFIEHESLYGVRGEVPDSEDHLVDFGRAALRREGGGRDDRGHLAHGRHRAARGGAVGERARRTGGGDRPAHAATLGPRRDPRLGREDQPRVVVEEGWPHGGVGANFSALISEQAFDDLDAPVRRVSGADVPMPYSKPLEDIAYPHEQQIVQATLEVLGQKAPVRSGRMTEP